MSKIQSGSLEYEKVIEYVYQKILSGELVIGSKLPTERALAEELGIGRSSAREALCILSGMGIVERIQGSGNYITKNASKSVTQIVAMTLALGRITEENIIEFRRVLERSLCIVIIEKGLTQEQIDEFEFILKKLRDAEVKDRLMWDKKFHDLLVKASGNQLFITITEAITYSYVKSMKNAIETSDNNDIKELIDSHDEIFESIRDKDYLRAVESVDKHFDIVEKVFHKEAENYGK